MNHLIEVQGLSRRLGDFALEDVSFSLAPGYVMGFVGPNGAGKSTTIKLILNLLRKDSGAVRLFGLDSVTDEVAAKQQIGFVLDDTHFPENMTVEQTGRFLSGFYHAWDDAVFRRYLDRFQLPGKKRVKALSTGMKAKLSMALALSHNAKLLILDEPTSGLDPVVRDDILSELFQVVKDPSRGVFFSTHITSDLDKVADYITFLHGGRIVLTTTRDEINERYAVVKGGKKHLPEVRDALLRCRETPFGFEGLTREAPALRRHGELVVEKAKIEDMMLYFEKGEAVCKG